MGTPVYPTLACSFVDGGAFERQRRIDRRLVLQQAGAAGIEAVARRLFGRRDEQRRDQDAADPKPRLAQPACGADRGAALVEPEPAAEQCALARRIDADI